MTVQTTIKQRHLTTIIKTTIRTTATIRTTTVRTTIRTTTTIKTATI